jgi:phosphoribosylformylglycinamidine synthase
LEEEYALQEQVKMLIRQGVLQSAHDVSEGGLFVALMESAMAGSLGFDITTDAEIRTDALLFGESQSRVVVTVAPEKEEAFIDLMMLNGVEFDLLGHVTKGSIRVDDEEWGMFEEYKDIYDHGIHRVLA